VWGERGAPRGWLRLGWVEVPEDQRTSTSPDLKDLDVSEPTLCCRASGGYCDRCDLLVGLDGLHVTAVERDDGGGLTITVESVAASMGCRSCGVVAHAHGRVEVRLVDAPAMGRPVRIRWRKRRWICPEPGCHVGSFVEQDEQVAAPRAKLTVRACRWAIEQIRREHASVNGIRRQLGTGWRTVWEAILPLLEAADQDASRFDGVAILGVDEHVVRHEALLFRMEVRDLHRLVVVATG